jgi:RNA-directed DNA polymerase
MRQMTFDEVPEREVRAEGSDEPLGVERAPAVRGHESPGSDDLMERVLDRSNLTIALKRVEANRGSAGVDGMTTRELRPWLKENWPSIRAALEAGTYEPQPVRWHAIPKDGGGERELGIPTVLDRLVQQALLQVLQPMLDPSFSEHSFGFRPGRSAHDAVEAARRYIQDGRRIVVDVDLERFFDRVNHDVLMDRMAKRINDKRVLRLIRRFLNAGILKHGVKLTRDEGTPQGGPLSPLLANVLLDEVDKQLERRGHAFVRYADDCNVYVRSQRAGERIMEQLRKLYAKLRLKINESKSAVGYATTRKFLGFSFWISPGSRVKRKVAKKALDKLKRTVKEKTRRNGGRSMQAVIEDLSKYLVGWKAYFGAAETPRVFGRLDAWIRHRLRAVQLRQWKRGRTAFRELCRLGCSPEAARVGAGHARRWWHSACHGLNYALSTAYLAQLGLANLRDG